MDTINYQICKFVVFLQFFCTIPKVQPCNYMTKIAELFVQNINLNKGKAREESKHLHALKQLRKNLQRGNDKGEWSYITQCTHHIRLAHTQIICENNTLNPLLINQSIQIPITLQNEPQRSPHLQQNIITQDYDDNPAAINFSQHHVCHNHPPYLNVTLHLKKQKITITWPFFKHYNTSWNRWNHHQQWKIGHWAI